MSKFVWVYAKASPCSHHRCLWDCDRHVPPPKREREIERKDRGSKQLTIPNTTHYGCIIHIVLEVQYARETKLSFWQAIYLSCELQLAFICAVRL